MPEFRYECDEYGEHKSGSIQADSRSEAVERLREEGMEVLSLEMEPSSAPPPVTSTHSLSWDDVALFNEQLEGVVTGNHPLAPALAHVAREMRSKRMREAVETLQRDIDQGMSLEEALERQDGAFPSLYIRMIGAGEKTGSLSTILSQLTDYAHTVADLRDRIVEAVVYPSILITFGCFLVAFLAIKVMPTFREVFAEFESEMPWLTVKILDLSYVFRTRWMTPAVILACVILLFGWNRQLRHRRGRGIALLDMLVLHVPFFGRLIRTDILSRMARAMATLLRAGVPLDEAFELSAACADNGRFQDVTHRIATEVRNGSTLADAMDSEPIFPLTWLWLVGVGETSGSLPDTFERLGETYKRRVEHRAKMIAVVLPIVTVLLLGLFVGTLVLALYMPLFSLVDSLSGAV
ncbi:type II secretion system F family protein [Candidatus Hydrogenedentota bacterium]